MTVTYGGELLYLWIWRGRSTRSAQIIVAGCLPHCALNRAADHRPKSAPLSKNRFLKYILDFLVLNQSVISEVCPNDFYKFLHQGFKSYELINISFSYFLVFDENFFKRV